MRAVPALLAYAALVLLRMPQVILQGRFWGEEGTVFFRNAWTLPPLEALLRPYDGYLNLPATAAGLLARWTVPLEGAPYVTTGVALLFQLLPPALVLAARDPWLAEWPVRLAALCLLLLVPGCDEIWLQSVSSQFELSLAAALLLVLDIPPSRFVPLAVLVLAPLAGPEPIALLPLFLARAALDQSRGRGLQAAALAAGTALQLFLFFSAAAKRGLAIKPALLLAIVSVRHLLAPFLGVGPARDAGAQAYADIEAGAWPLLLTALPLLAAVLVLLALVRTRSRPAAWCFAAAFVVAGTAYVGGLDGAAALSPLVGERYAFVPQSLIGLGLLGLAAARSGLTSAMAALLCAGLALRGGIDYFSPRHEMATGPDWRAQVAAWRADPARPLHEWPVPWTFDLPPVTRTGVPSN